MRVTLFHQLVVAGLLLVGTLAADAVLDSGSGGKGQFDFLAGVLLMVAFTGPILRRLSVWPLIPRCPRCGAWVNGFYRAPHPGGVLLVSAVCGHAFRMEGDWVEPIFRGRSKAAQKAVAEMGWMRQADERVFRFRSDYACVLLDEEGEPIGRRRSKWPYWLVRWTME